MRNFSILVFSVLACGVSHAQYSLGFTYSWPGSAAHGSANGIYPNLPNIFTTADSTGISGTVTDDTTVTFGIQVVFTGASTSEPTATGELTLTVLNSANANAKVNKTGSSATASGDAYGETRSVSATPGFPDGAATPQPFPSNSFNIFGNGLSFTQNADGSWTAIESFVAQALNSTPTTNESNPTDKEGGFAESFAYYESLVNTGFGVTGN